LRHLIYKGFSWGSTGSYSRQGGAKLETVLTWATPKEGHPLDLGMAGDLRKLHHRVNLSHLLGTLLAWLELHLRLGQHRVDLYFNVLTACSNDKENKG
jgi:hypothetical protein